MATAITGTAPINTKHTRIRPLAVAGSLLAILVGAGLLGLQVRPAAFPGLAQASAPPDTIPLPGGLPAPVARFYRQIYGERVPLIRTAVISGRGWLRIAGLKLPARFRFTHDAGRSYRHYIETTLFGLPVMKVNEYYVDDAERMELPWGVDQNNPKLDQGGNLGMWAELLRWAPATLVTDPRVRWEPVDDATAILVVPFEAQQQDERFVVRFDPASGQVRLWEVMRYKGGVGEKTLWVNGAWFDDGGPWASFESEDVAFNVAVDTAVTVKGP